MSHWIKRVDLPRLLTHRLPFMMNARKKAALYTQLATLARAGVPLHQATASLRPYFGQSGIPLLIQNLEEGHPLSTGMEQARFAPFEIRMIRAGEQTGRIEHIFQQLAVYWESEANLKSSLIRQSLYPIILLHAAILAIPAGLLVESVPAYLTSVGLNLFLLYGGAALLFLALRWSWHQGPGQRLILGIPVLGKAFRTAAAWRWIQVAEIEFSAGIPLPESVRDAWLATGWIHAEERARIAENRLNDGENLSSLYRDWPELPRDWEVFLITGENAGKLHESFAQLTIEARRHWENTQKSLSEWLPRIFYAGITLLVVIQIISACRSYFAEVNKLLDM